MHRILTLLFIILLFSISILSQDSTDKQDINNALPPDEVPPVIFKTHGFNIQHSNLLGDPVVANFPRTLGNNWAWNLSSPGSTRSASTSGMVTIGSASGEFSAQGSLTNAGNLTWHGIGSQGGLEVWVRGSGTPYYYSQQMFGSLNYSNANAGLVSMHPIGNPNVSCSGSGTGHMECENNDTVDNGVTGGSTCGTVFTEYPNIVFCRVAAFSIGSSVLLVNGLPIILDLSGNSSGSFNVLAFIRQGVPPIANISPTTITFRDNSSTMRESVYLGNKVTISDISYDPDDGTTPGIGIIGNEWRLTDPDGNTTITPNTSSLTFDATKLGNYRLRLGVWDNEGMSDVIQKTFNVQEPIPYIENVEDITETKNIERTMVIKNYVNSSSGDIRDLLGLQVRENLDVRNLGGGNCLAIFAYYPPPMKRCSFKQRLGSLSSNPISPDVEANRFYFFDYFFPLYEWTLSQPLWINEVDVNMRYEVKQKYLWKVSVIRDEWRDLKNGEASIFRSWGYQVKNNTRYWRYKVERLSISRSFDVFQEPNIPPSNNKNDSKKSKWRNKL